MRQIKNILFIICLIRENPRLVFSGFIRVPHSAFRIPLLAAFLNIRLEGLSQPFLRAVVSVVDVGTLEHLSIVS